MKTISKIIVIAMILIYPITLLAAGGHIQHAGKKHHKPPKEAFEACTDKEAGDEAQFETPDGKIVTGTCEEVGDQLVLRPDNAEGDSGMKFHGPPPEAFCACNDKEEGDSAQFQTPDGETVSGTCVQMGDRLVLKPYEDQTGNDGDNE